MIQKDFTGILQEGEHIEKVIEKHPIVYLFSGGIFLIFLAFSLVFVSQMWILEDVLWDGLVWGLFSLFLLAYLSFIFLSILSDLLDTLVITDRRVISIRRDPPFGRETQSIALSEVTAIHAETKGILPTLFWYGKVEVEYMWGAQKVHFSYAPHPSDIINLIHDIKSKKAE